MQVNAVTYLKGGRILNMLRYYLGDSIFNKSLCLYLNTYKYKSAEAQELRLAFEEVSGQDLNWYWNQWYYGSGHPKFNIDYKYDDAEGKASVIIHQIQNTGKIFRIPMSIDVYEGTSKKRYPVCLQNETDTFTFLYKQKPALINVDGDKIILCEKQDNKTMENFIFQYHHAESFVDRLEAITFCSQYQDNPIAIDFLKTSLKDQFSGLRSFTIEKLDFKNEKIRNLFAPLVAEMATKDPSSTVRGQSIISLGSIKNFDYEELFIKAARDSSYQVAGNALEALNMIDTLSALNVAKQLGAEPAKKKLLMVIFNLLLKCGDEQCANTVVDKFSMMNIYQKMETIQPFTKYLEVVKNSEKLKEGVDQIIWLREFFPKIEFKEVINNMNEDLKTLAEQKALEGLVEQADYIISKLN
jgi:aminopeptidase N